MIGLGKEEPALCQRSRVLRREYQCENFEPAGTDTLKEKKAVGRQLAESDKAIKKIHALQAGLCIYASQAMIGRKISTSTTTIQRIKLFLKASYGIKHSSKFIRFF